MTWIPKNNTSWSKKKLHFQLIHKKQYKIFKEKNILSVHETVIQLTNSTTSSHASKTDHKSHAKSRSHKHLFVTVLPPPKICLRKGNLFRPRRGRLVGLQDISWGGLHAVVHVDVWGRIGVVLFPARAVAAFAAYVAAERPGIGSSISWYGKDVRRIEDMLRITLKITCNKSPRSSEKRPWSPYWSTRRWGGWGQSWSIPPRRQPPPRMEGRGTRSRRELLLCTWDKQIISLS